MQALRDRLKEVLQIRETQAEMAELLGSQAGSSLVRWNMVPLCDHCTLEGFLGCVRSYRSGDNQTHASDQMTNAWCGIDLNAEHCLEPHHASCQCLPSIAEGGCPQQAKLM